MSKFKIYERAFHPDEDFGPGGLYFEGDNRGFSNSETGATSRVWSRLTIDTFVPMKTYINPSEEFVVESEPSKAPPLLGGRPETYQTDDTRPSGEASSTGGQYVADDVQGIQVSIKTWGQNHAFPIEYLSDLRENNEWLSDVYDWVWGEDAPDNMESQLIIPELDITVKMHLLIDRHNKELHIRSHLLGDGFPNSEVFIVDGAGTSLFLNTHHRMGFALVQLTQDHKHMLASTIVTVGIDDNDNFIGPVKARRCVDFMPEDRDLLEGKGGDLEFGLSEWNRLHSSRDPSEKNENGYDTDSNFFSEGHQEPYDSEAGWFAPEPNIDNVDKWNHP